MISECFLQLCVQCKRDRRTAVTYMSLTYNYVISKAVNL